MSTVGDIISRRGVEVLGTNRLVVSGSIAAWGFIFPLVPVSELGCLTAFIFLVSMVPEGATVPAVDMAVWSALGVFAH